MTISKETVTKIAHLARIELQPDEQEKFAGELSKIVTWIEQLNKIDTAAVPPLDHAVSYSQRLRPDVIDHHTTSHTVLTNAHDTVLDFFSVPKVVE